MNNLTDRAMLINLNISMWSARRYDRQASKAVETQFGNAKDSSRVHKKLITDSLAVTTLKITANSAREFHYTYTLPWATEGSRILPASAYMTYTTKMRHFNQVFDEAVDAFVQEYPSLQAHAKQYLSGLYNEDDYPRVNEIGSRFQFVWSVLPIPDAGDFRVHLTDGEIDAIKEQITTETTHATQTAMQEVWQRLYEVVSKMSERLSNVDAIFRDSLVENVQSLCTLLPMLNLTNDARLTQLGVEVSKQLCAFTPDILRDNKVARATTAQAAAALQSKLSAMMGV